MARKAKRGKVTARKSTATASPIPPGLRTVTPYLAIHGAGPAIDWYKKAFGAKEVSRAPGPGGTIMNAAIKIGDSIVMMSDEFPGADVKSPTTLGTSTVSLHIYTKAVDKLWDRAVGAGAKVTMPLENQFWGERYGQIADPFGHRWALGQRVKMSKQEMETKRQAAMAMFEKGEHPGYESQS